MSSTQESIDPLVARLDAAEANAAEQVNGIDVDHPVDLDQVLGNGHEPGPEPAYVRDYFEAKTKIIKPAGAWCPAVITASDMDRDPPAPAVWIIAGLLPTGLIVLGGRPKAGKSILALDAALAVADSGMFLGCEAAQGEVLYLDLENGKRRIYDRLKFRLRGSPLPANLRFVLEWRAGNRAALLQMLDERPRIRLVVIDIWSKFRAPIARQEDRYQQDQRELAWLADEAKRRNIAIVVVVHLIKGEAADDPYSAVGGSSAVTGNADAVFMLRRLPNGDASDRSLRFIGRDLDDTEWVLAVEHPIGFAFKSTADQRISPKQASYLIEMHEVGQAMTQAEVARRLEVSRTTAKQMLDALALRGLVQNPMGPYTLTEAGRAAIERM
jgi:hypothetical protein